MSSTRPTVSVLMPCHNEERYIAQALESLIDDYCLKNCEIIVVDGMSEDRTQDIVNSLIKKGLPIRLFRNKKKLQVHGLNLALAKAKGEIIVRADAHCLYPPEYIKRCVELLKTKDVSNVGGIMLPKGEKTIQKAIALALRHPVGVGDAKWHLGNYSGNTDTVYLGTFRKELFDDVGFYDPNSHPNEDAELNLRIRKSGRKVYLDSSIQVTYFPRESLRELAIQYFSYGRGRCYTTLKHKRITSYRQIAPITLVLALFFSILLSFFQPLFLLFPFSYLFLVFLTAQLSWPKQSISFKQRILTGLAFLIMHTSWGTGFLSRLIFRQ
jgi:succinoglycan biosynthesis protein ExoA